MTSLERPARGRPPVPVSAKNAWTYWRARIDLEGLARALRISAPAVYKWPHVPAGRLDKVARLTGVRREDLRPDLFPPLPGPWNDL